jgi:hypothetical protein
MNRLHRILIAATLALPVAARAENTGYTEQFYLGYSDWNYKVAGEYQSGGSAYDLGNGFDASRSSRGLYRLRWDTGPGWWRPDLAASFGRIEVSGQRNITSSGNIGPIPVQGNSTAEVDANVRDLDATARWPWQFGWARLSAGLTLKQLRGDVLVTDSAAQRREPVNALFPLLHAFLEVPIGSRLRIGVGGDWIEGKGNEADSIVAIARLKLIGPLDLTGGWQRKRYKVRTNDYLLDSRLQGWQIGGELAF